MNHSLAAWATSYTQSLDHSQAIDALKSLSSPSSSKDESLDGVSDTSEDEVLPELGEMAVPRRALHASLPVNRPEALQSQTEPPQTLVTQAQSLPMVCNKLSPLRRSIQSA